MINREDFYSLHRSISDDSEFFKKIVDGIVTHYSRELDEFVELVRHYLQLIKENTMDTYNDDDLQMQIIKLPTIMYFAGNGLEDIGSESDIAPTKDDVLQVMRTYWNNSMKELKRQMYDCI